MNYVVTVKGFADKVMEDGQYDVVYEIDLDNPLTMQLLALPDDNPTVVLPDTMPQEQQKKLFEIFQEILLSRAVTVQAISQRHFEWVSNIVQNATICAESWPIHQMLKLEDVSTTAIIVGNGPSAISTLHKLNNIESANLFACWHVWPKLKAMGLDPCLIGHNDSRNPHKQDGLDVLFDDTDLPENSKSVFAFVPTSCPDFIKAMNRSTKQVGFVYYSREIPYHGIMASVNHSSDHRAVIGNVAHFLANCAVYSGHKTIALCGVDLAWKEPQAHCVRVINQSGNVCFTTAAMEVYRSGMIAFAEQNPDLNLINLSNIGLDIPGFRNVGVEEFMSS